MKLVAIYYGERQAIGGYIDLKPIILDNNDIEMDHHGYVVIIIQNEAAMGVIIGLVMFLDNETMLSVLTDAEMEFTFSVLMNVVSEILIEDAKYINALLTYCVPLERIADEIIYTDSDADSIILYCAVMIPENNTVTVASTYPVNMAVVRIVDISPVQKIFNILENSVIGMSVSRTVELFSVSAAEVSDSINAVLSYVLAYNMGSSASEYMMEASETIDISFATTCGMAHSADICLNTESSIAMETDSSTIATLNVTSEDLTQTLCFTQSEANGVTIDWDDGSTPETANDTNVIIAHTYAEAGVYNVSMVAGQNVTWNPGAVNTDNYNICFMNVNSLGKAETTPPNASLIGFDFGVGCILSRAYSFYKCGGLTTIKIPSNTTEIPTSAFSYSGLTSITMPSTITSIGVSAFLNAAGLESFPIPNGVVVIGSSAFSNVSIPTELIIPDTVTTIETNAFSGCYGLKDVTIGSGVKRIGPGAFGGVLGSSIEHVYIKDLSKWCSILFEDRYSNPTACFGFLSSTDGNIGNIFINGKKITNLVVPNDVTKISDYCFIYCENIESITFNQNLTSIGAYAFSSCSKIESVTLPDSLTEIGSYAFAGTKISSVALPAGLSSIDGSSFQTDNMTAYSVPSSSSHYSSSDGILFDKNRYSLVAYPKNKSGTSYTVGNRIISIEKYAFHANNNLRTIWIYRVSATGYPKGITIREAAFENSKITSISLPVGDQNDNVFIGNRAFSYTDITSITIPEYANYIGEGAFLGCDIQSATINGYNAEIMDNAFSYCHSLTKVWIRNGITKIWASSSKGGQFIKCDNLTTIYAEPASKPEGWKEYWDTKDTGTSSQKYTVVYGTTTRPW